MTVVVLLTATLTALQLTSPAIYAALSRQPAAIAAGQWWRLLTPILVEEPSQLWAQAVRVNPAGATGAGGAPLDLARIVRVDLVAGRGARTRGCRRCGPG